MLILCKYPRPTDGRTGGQTDKHIKSIVRNLTKGQLFRKQEVLGFRSGKQEVRGFRSGKQEVLGQGVWLNAPEFDINISAVQLFFAIVFGPNVEILLAFDIEFTEKLVIRDVTLYLFDNKLVLKQSFNKYLLKWKNRLDLC